MPASRKFKPDDIVWAHEAFHRRGGYVRFKVLEIVKRSYAIARLYDDGSLGRTEIHSFAKAEGLFRTRAEVDDIQYVSAHRYKIRERIERLDAATLRRVAELIGYKEET